MWIYDQIKQLFSNDEVFESEDTYDIKVDNTRKVVPYQHQSPEKHYKDSPCGGKMLYRHNRLVSKELFDKAVMVCNAYYRAVRSSGTHWNTNLMYDPEKFMFDITDDFVYDGEQYLRVELFKECKITGDARDTLTDGLCLETWDLSEHNEIHIPMEIVNNGRWEDYYNYFLKRVIDG